MYIDDTLVPDAELDAALRDAKARVGDGGVILGIEIAVEQQHARIIQRRVTAVGFRKLTITNVITTTVPAPAAGPPKPPPPSLVVAVTGAGTPSVLGRVLTGEQLDAILNAAAERNARTRVILEVERSVRYGDVVGVMERIKRAGLDAIALSIEPPAQP